MPVLRALGRAFPDHQRVLAAPAWLTPLADLVGAVHAVVDTAPLAALGTQLHGADLAVNLHGRGPESTALLAATGPVRLVAWGLHGTVFDPDEHEVHRWCRLLDCAGIPADPTDLYLEVAVEPGATTVLHIGAATPAKRWPVERWAAVARSEAAAGRAVVLTGNGAERPAAEAVATDAGLPPEAVLAGRQDLRQLVDTVAAAARVVVGDTGVAHLATALRRPSVVLFGPVPPSRWGPPAGGPHEVLWAGQSSDPFGADPAPGLLEISPDDVLAALARLRD